MNEISIKRHSFDLAKNRLKEFSTKTEAELEIDKVRTDGGFLGLGDHKVTGYELNNRLETVQDHFISVNETNNKIIKEFRQIYNALDVLDKDYITSIVANVMAIKKTSDDVRVQQVTLKNHNEKLESQQSKLDAHQTEIEKNVTNISKIVSTLKTFKERLEGYNHLMDIDKIWNDFQKSNMEISALSGSVSQVLSIGKENANMIETVKQSIETVDCNVTSFSKSLNEQIERIENIMSFVQEIKATTHWRDIDKIWDSLEHSHAMLKKVHDELDDTMQVVEKQQINIAEILRYIETLSKHEHLKDIDSIWRTSEKHSSQIDELQEQVEDSNKLIQQHREVVEQSFNLEKERSDALLKQLNKRIQYAYWIAGGSMSLALIELIIILFR